VFVDVEPLFCRGFAIGFLAAGIIGFILVQIRANRAKMGMMYKPLDTFPDAAQPHLTPIGIVRKGSCSCFYFLFWFGMLGIAVVITANVFLNNGNINTAQLVKWFDRLFNFFSLPG
jgi:hypothetical protein